MVLFNGVPTDLPNGIPSLTVYSLYVLRNGQPINLSDSGVSFSSVSGDGQYLATLDRSQLTTESGQPFSQLNGDVFIFSESSEIEPGFFTYGPNQRAIIEIDLADIQQQLDTLTPPPAQIPLDPNDVAKDVIFGEVGNEQTGTLECESEIIPSGSGTAELKGIPSLPLIGEPLVPNESFTKTSCVNYQDVLANFPCISVNQCVPRSAVEAQIKLAIETVEDILGKCICPTYKCKYVNGTGHNELYLNEDMVSVESVDYLCGDRCSSNCDCRDQIPVPKLMGDTLVFDCCDAKFPCGERNVKVCGVWGSGVTNGLKRVISGLALEAAQPGITGLAETNQGIDSISWGDVSLSYSDLDTDIGLTTGFVELDNILARYIRVDDQVSFSIVSTCDDACSCSNKNNCNCN